MALHTRVIVSVLHPTHGFVRECTDRGAKYHDAADIERVAAGITAEMKRRYGEDARIKVTTRDAG